MSGNDDKETDPLMTSCSQNIPNPDSSPGITSTRHDTDHQVADAQLADVQVSNLLKTQEVPSNTELNSSSGKIVDSNTAKQSQDTLEASTDSADANKTCSKSVDGPSMTPADNFAQINKDTQEQSHLNVNNINVELKEDSCENSLSEQKPAEDDDAETMQQGDEAAAIVEQPGMLPAFCPPQLQGLLDCMQVVVHKDNLRHNIAISESAIARYEVIDETRRVLFYVEKQPAPLTEQSFCYRLFDKNKQPAIEVYNPLSQSCFMCHSSWHCLRKYKSQTVIFSPPGQVAGFLKRSHTCFLQEFEVLSPQEDLLLRMRGGPYDLTIYSIDLETGLGRLAVRGWHGIMHEVKRTGDDIGLTFPLDLDVRVKAVLIGAIFAIDWFYSTRSGTR